MWMFVVQATFVRREFSLLVREIENSKKDILSLRSAPLSSSASEELRGKIKADKFEHVAPTEPRFLFSHIATNTMLLRSALLEMADSGRSGQIQKSKNTSLNAECDSEFCPDSNRDQNSEFPESPRLKSSTNTMLLRAN
jgi:hypothetical protein